MATLKKLVVAFLSKVQTDHPEIKEYADYTVPEVKALAEKIDFLKKEVVA